MKKKIFSCIIYVLAIFICSCGRNETTSLNFPDLQWGMTPEEAKEALKLQDADISVSDESGRGSAFIVNDFELFGVKSKYTSFQFLDFEDQGNYSFCEAIVQYPDDADMDSVYKEMRKRYGEPLPELTVYELNLYTDMPGPKNYKNSKQTKAWGTQDISAWIPEKESGAYYNAWKPFLGILTDAEAWDTFIHAAKMNSILWLNEKDSKRLFFFAYHMGVYNAINEQIEH